MLEASVIIPHFNDLIGLDRCLSSLQMQTFDADRFEIIVVDNGSPQGLAAVEEIVCGRAQLCLVEDRGAGPARNGGVLRASAPIVAFIDSDCVAEPQWLAAGIKGLQDFDFCGGPVNVLVEKPSPWSATEAFEMVFAFRNEDYIKTKGFTGSGNLFTYRHVFDAVGGFGSEISEDYDWSHRATAKGFRLGFVRDAAIGHPARQNWAELRRKWLRVQSETFALRPPTPINKARWLIRSWAMPLSILAHIPRILVHPGLPTVRDRWSATLGLMRLRLWRWWDGHRLVFGWRRD
jgi:glycosyltransferase involved in cell wall biosynthesis